MIVLFSHLPAGSWASPEPHEAGPGGGVQAGQKQKGHVGSTPNLGRQSLHSGPGFTTSPARSLTLPGGPLFSLAF